MNSTLQIVLITIASVHILNFIVLVLDEEFGWRYEDYAKRFCCLSAYLVLFVFVLLPISIAKKFEHRNRKNRKFIVTRMLVGDKWHDSYGEETIAISVSYDLAFESIKKDIESQKKEHPNELDFFRREYQDVFMVGDEDGYAIKYEIKEGR